VKGLKTAAAAVKVTIFWINFFLDNSREQDK
jgi:hypothetical protein